ncbi:ABC transporter substrate-binding protein [Leucobacter sp. UCMA 4100]|uniref:ABC transporter substrate-binding protein n=1 Tax=Leucobacter sp. UCMA 4100 TaxID=2810534 RepID=UPI0022EA5385|nr:ABC transporter substrate-binding protein [Leucobacter sp. UCMA 4100]
MNTTSTRFFGSVGLALSLTLLMSGCAKNADSDAEASTNSGQSAESFLPAAEGKTEYPLTLETPYGETVLEERPERVAAIVPNAIDTELLLSLGVTPVLSSNFVSEGGYLAEHGAEELTTYEYMMGEDIPIEAIAASEPDLIIAVGWVPGFGDLGDSYDQLASIAPVAASPASDQRMIRWQDSIEIIGEALDLSDTAHSVIEQHDEHFTEIREAHPEFAGKTATWAIYYGPANGLQYFSQEGSAPEGFLTDLGFEKNPEAASFSGDTTVSDELVGKIDADVLLLGQSAAASDAELDALTGRDLFQNLGAVTSGRFIQLPPKTEDGGDLLWAITSGGPIGNAWAADHLVPLLADTL